MHIVENHRGKRDVVRVVLDTNIFISSVIFGGIPEEVVSLCRTGVVNAGVSDSILEELADVLARKFNWEDGQIGLMEEEIFSFAEHVECGKKIRMPKLSLGDRRILETAIVFQADVIITGDSDLLDLRNFRDIPMMTPREFITRREKLIG